MSAPAKGRLLVIEGLDGSGKATQAGLLAAALAADGLPVRQGPASRTMPATRPPWCGCTCPGSLGQSPTM